MTTDLVGVPVLLARPPAPLAMVVVPVRVERAHHWCTVVSVEGLDPVHLSLSLFATSELVAGVEVDVPPVTTLTPSYLIGDLVMLEGDVVAPFERTPHGHRCVVVSGAGDRARGDVVVVSNTLLLDALLIGRFPHPFVVADRVPFAGAA